MSDELATAVGELCDVYDSQRTDDQDNFPDGVLAVATHVLADDASVARYRALLGIETARPYLPLDDIITPITVCTRCGKEIRTSDGVYGFGSDTGWIHARCPVQALGAATGETPAKGQ